MTELCLVTLGVVSKRMQRRHPSTALPHRIAFSETPDEVPVIWHQAERLEFDGLFFASLTQFPQEGRIIFQKTSPADYPLEDEFIL
jgi:hypothetical protein